MKYIPLDQCGDRAVYSLRSNNLGIGVFSKETRGFIGIRTKFGNKYLFTEYHHDTGAPFGTACPVEKIGMLPDNIENRELETNKNNQSLMDFLAANKDCKGTPTPEGIFVKESA
jgi:hypothetical protein